MGTSRKTALAPQKTVLVVDDEAPVLRCLCRELTRGGYKVVSASSGAQALEMLADTRVDALITDHRMPGMLGSELVAAAAKIQPWLRKVIVTGSPEEVSPLATADVLIVAKPWPQDALVQLVFAELHSGPPSDCVLGSLPMTGLLSALISFA